MGKKWYQKVLYKKENMKRNHDAFNLILNGFKTQNVFQLKIYVQNIKYIFSDLASWKLQFSHNAWK